MARCSPQSVDDLRSYIKCLFLADSQPSCQNIPLPFPASVLLHITAVGEEGIERR